MDAFVLDLLILRLKVKVCLIYKIIFSKLMWKEWQNITKVFSLTTSLRWENYIALFVVIIENLKNLEYERNEDEKVFKEEELIEILIIIALIENM